MEYSISIYFIFLAVIAVYFLWAGLVHPNQVKERVIMKVLDTYQMELKAGVKESRLPAMIGESITDEDIKNGKTSETRSEHSDRP